MTEGIINIRKEPGMTSHDVVSRVRRIFHIRRVGHTGTLDPMATGVLPVCIGRSTRVMEYLDPDLKTYRCKMVLGREFDTQDIWGEVVNESGEDVVNAITEERVQKVLHSFNGVQEQTPPMYSAVKVDGKRLYEYAREGKTVDVKSRTIYIGDVFVEDMNLRRGYESSIQFTMTCSKGTYVRTVCQETGKKLGTYAAMTELSRIRSGIFELDRAIRLDDLEKLSEEEREKLLIPPYEPIAPHFGLVRLRGEDGYKLMHGLAIPRERVQILSEPPYRHHSFVLPLPEIYEHGYLAYADLRESKTDAPAGLSFLGVVREQPEEQRMKAAKILFPQE